MDKGNPQTHPPEDWVAPGQSPQELNARIRELEAQLEAYRKIDKKRFTYMIKLEAQVEELKQERPIDVYNQGWNDALKALIQGVNKDEEAAIKGDES